ncbi:MAG: hypothetical protein [Arizlama microvirus]|nr:MAG: hypothetical protein [Arizlama microvirus]
MIPHPLNPRLRSFASIEAFIFSMVSSLGSAGSPSSGIPVPKVSSFLSGSVNRSGLAITSPILRHFSASRAMASWKNCCAIIAACPISGRSLLVTSRLPPSMFVVVTFQPFSVFQRRTLYSTAAIGAFASDDFDMFLLHCFHNPSGDGFSVVHLSGVL